MPTPLRILVLEDDPLDAELEIAALEESGYLCRWERVETRDDFLAQLALPAAHDLILADYNLPNFDGLTALTLFLERKLDIPFILVSGTVGEETAIESLKAGATDYVLKDRLSRLGPVVKRALLEKKERQRRRQAEEQLRKAASSNRSRYEAHQHLGRLLMASGKQKDAVESLRKARSVLTPGVFLFGVVMPPIGASLGLLAGLLLGLSTGGTMLFMTLCASASYIAVPAAMRVALPEANPSIYLTLSLGVTFPFNLTLGIPLYLAVASAATGG